MLVSIFLVLFCLTPARSQEEGAENKLPVTDQRRIIEILLTDKFKGSSEKTIYISTINLSGEIQKDFPLLKNKKIRLVSPEHAAEADLCAYEFGEFEFIDKFVSVAFGNCREGLAYDFIKSGGDWKSVGLVVIKPVLY